MTALSNNMRWALGHVGFIGLVLTAFLLGLFFFHDSAAQEGDSLAPAARVGQLSVVSNNVRMRIDRTSAWEEAVLNTPITTGSALATQIPGRIEVRIGSTALRLGQGAQVMWTEISDSKLHMEINDGLFALRVRMLAPGESVLLKAGAVSVQVLKPGAYRFRHVADRARLSVWVLEGQARVTLSEQNLTLDPGQQVQIDKGIATQLASSANEDHASFNEFVEGRDRRSEGSLSLMHVSPEVTGAEDLDGHGNWRDEVGYGAVWFPNKLPVDWAPYRFGRWRWLAPWGWTWVDNAPWGFTPFHYGRWVFSGGRWGWVPSQHSAANALSRPVYAPALVGFFGNQAGAVWTSSAASTPVVGWYPLAPGEIYWPAYSTQTSYVRALNATSVSEAGQIQAQPGAAAFGQPHRYARTAFAASVMPYSAFSTMQDVANNQIVLSPALLAQAPLVQRRIPPPPTLAPLPAKTR
jgi:hypothetical protein